jgi:hypothetical protein
VGEFTWIINYNQYRRKKSMNTILPSLRNVWQSHNKSSVINLLFNNGLYSGDCFINISGSFQFKPFHNGMFIRNDVLAEKSFSLLFRRQANNSSSDLRLYKNYNSCVRKSEYVFLMPSSKLISCFQPRACALLTSINLRGVPSGFVASQIISPL